VLDPGLALRTSLDVFEKLGWGGIAAGVLFLIASFFIKGWSNGANDASNHPGPTLTDRGQEDGNIAAPTTSTP